MSKVLVSAASAPRMRALTLSASLTSSLTCLALLSGAGGAVAATPGKTYFFASRQACAVSGAFSREECVAAFLNASAQLQDRAPHFSSSGECRARFQLCEVRREGAAGDALAYAETETIAYTPVALGVEMILTARGVESAPTLAVETSAKLFPKIPVARPYAPQESEAPRVEAPRQGMKLTAILPADHFEPFPGRQPIDVRAAFRPFALGSLEEASPGSASEETPAQRRARLKSAPFIE